MKIPPPAAHGGTSCRNPSDPAGCTLRSVCGLALSLPHVRCACSVGRPSVSTLCLVLLRLTSSRTTPFRVSAARSRAPLLFLSQRRSRAALLPSPAASRGAAGLLLFLRPPGEGWAERREAHLYSHRACEARLPC